MLFGKRILLGICGSISCYKSAELVRLLIKAGAEVKVVMTKDASTFITPLTLSTLSKNPVFIDFVANEDGTWNNHVELGIWADLILIAPISANTLSKFAHGICDNLLSAVYLSAKCEVLLAPAMDVDMWKHPSTQKNIDLVKSFGNIVIEPESGELASGLHGIGRLAEPITILSIVEKYFLAKNDFEHTRILITAGPTYEEIDPVRFIGNHSSGKMGFSIAEEFALRGASVCLISGPSHLNCSEKIARVNVTTANQMFEEAISRVDSHDIIIMSAAVADYTPILKSTQKIKKNEDRFQIEMIKTKDILAHVGSTKKDNQFLVGFALETNDAIENAKMKLVSKNLDMIIVNTLEDIGAGFSQKKDLNENAATNKISIITSDKKITEYKLKSKTEVAHDIIEKIKEVRS